MYSITAENSNTWNSLNIKEDFRLLISCMKMRRDVRK